MSLLSRERLVVSLAPDQLTVLRLGMGRSRSPRKQHAEALPGNGSQPWSNGLEALEILLDDPAWGGPEITIILSNHFVHYAVLPKINHLTAAAGNDLARLIFGKLFGELAHDWELRVSPGGPQPTLACGVPHALLTDLRAACEGRGTLRSIQPALMAVFNRARSVIARQSGTLALLESQRLTLARIENGQWQSISSRAGSAAALPELLREAAALAGGASGGRLWLCDPAGEARLPPGGAWQVEHLPGGHAYVGSLAAWGMS